MGTCTSTHWTSCCNSEGLRNLLVCVCMCVCFSWLVDLPVAIRGHSICGLIPGGPDAVLSWLPGTPCVCQGRAKPFGCISHSLVRVCVRVLFLSGHKFECVCVSCCQPVAWVAAHLDRLCLGEGCVKQSCCLVVHR